MNDITHPAGGPFSAPLLNITRHSAERSLLSLMELGNPAFLTVQLNLSITERYAEAVADLAHSSLTQAKFQGIAFTNLACRSAITAGVSEETAHTIRNIFSERFTKMTDPSRQWSLACEMLLCFSQSIRDAALRDCSPAVVRCCQYIDEHFHMSISLNELGRVCDLSDHYVSDLFRRELGMGALQYMHQIKLTHAKYLLEQSSLSIAEISSMLSYPSHSNFSQQFKKNYGVTPGEYRELNANA